MTTTQDSTNKNEGAPRPSGSPPDGPRRASGPDRQSTMPSSRSWLWFALILLANFLLFRSLFPGPETSVEVPYTSFKEEVRAGNVETIYGSGDSVEGRFEEPVTYPPEGEAGAGPPPPPSLPPPLFSTPPPPLPCPRPPKLF